MATTYTLTASPTGNANVDEYGPTAAEMALWKYIEPFASARAALMLDVSGPLLYASLGPADGQAEALLQDRVGDRDFSPGAGRHPIVVTDSLSNKPALLFGGGGGGPNILTPALNGDLEQASVLSGGVEVNRLPLFAPGSGYSIAAAIRVPAPNSVVNGVAFGPSVGGKFFGGCSSSGSPGSPSWEVSQEDGALVCRNVAFSANPGAPAGTADRRNSQWLKFVQTYDATSKQMMIWVGGATSTPFPGSNVDDMSSEGGNVALPRIGGSGNSGDLLEDPFVGFLAGLAYIPSPIFTNEVARTAAFNWLAERSV